jgi:acetoin utilization protein AcuB
VNAVHAAFLHPLTHAVSQYMTASPHSIGRDQTLETAHAMMRANGIRHLPVLDGGKLAGVVSLRDLYFVESLAGADPRIVCVEEAMSPDTYAVSPDMAVEQVAADMAAHGYGCAVVIARDEVTGIFTTTDALRAISRLLSRAAEASS